MEAILIRRYSSRHRWHDDLGNAKSERDDVVIVTVIV